jgi:hypothetical protein
MAGLAHLVDSNALLRLTKHDDPRYPAIVHAFSFSANATRHFAAPLKLWLNFGTYRRVPLLTTDLA